MSNKYAKVAVLRNFFEPLEIKEIQVPELDEHQVLVRMIYASICGSQLFEWRGERENKKWLPHVLGHEGYAEILSKGKNVKAFANGDRVIVSWLSNGLTESISPKYVGTDGEGINSGRNAVFATHAVISQNKIFKAPSGIDPKVAPLWGCAIPTGAGMVRKLREHKLRANVLVKGFGGVGMAAAYCLKSLDYENVYVDDTSEERLQVAVNSGFALSRYLGTSCKYDLVFDTTGSAKALEESFHILTEKGKLVFASHPPKNSKITIDPFDLIKGKTIEGTWGGEIRSQFDLDSLYGIVGDKISRRDFIGAEFPFESINDALHYALKAHSGRALIFFGKEKVSQ